MRLTCKRYDEIKNVIITLFELWDVHICPISGMALAKKMGISLISYQSLPFEKQKYLLDFSQDGFAIMEKGEKFIYYNADCTNGRVNHTIMHEIGHIVLQHSEHSELAEAEAGFFAKFALAPPVLIHHLKTISVEEIQAHFKISNQAAIYALEYYHKWLNYQSRNHSTELDYRFRKQFQI